MAKAAHTPHATPGDADLVADFIGSVDVLSSALSEDEIRDSSSVHLWVVDQTAEEFFAAAECVSPSSEDEARATRLVSAEARRLFLAQRAALRLILGHHLGRAAHELGLIRLPGGKPALALCPGDPPLGFSLSHSGSWLAVAVASGSSLGVDIEVPRALAHAGAIAARWFLPAERAALDALSRTAGEDGFLALWTAKEALAKRHGAGLRLLRPGAEALAVAPEWRAGRLKAFRTPSGMIGALASSAPLSQVHHSRSLMDLLADR